MRIPFNKLFSVANGIITPIVTIHINGITMTPGVSFGSGVIFGGIDLSKFLGKDFEVDLNNGVYIVKGVYN